jgi:hypothetical protein
MSRSSSEDLRELMRRVEEDHREMARASERVCLEELEQRRRQLALECSKLLQHS